MTRIHLDPPSKGGLLLGVTGDCWGEMPGFGQGQEIDRNELKEREEGTNLPGSGRDRSRANCCRRAGYVPYWWLACVLGLWTEWTK